MASPLNWFRRNAIWIMVPVGIFCMAFFGLGAVFDTLTSTARSGTRDNPTVATFNGGKFTRDQISGMVREHFQTRNFLNELRNSGVEQRGDDFVDLVRPIAPIKDGQQEYIDQQVIDRKLMAVKAETEGLAVSESMIDQYIFATYGVLDGDGMSNRDLELLNRKVNNGQISMAAVRRHLKMELLNQQMVTLSYTGIPRVPSPLESIQFYAKVNQKVDCEVFPVSISDYVDETAEPSQSEIRELYEAGKFEFKDPTGKRPGFKMSRRVKLQYLTGDYQDFLDKATEGLSDEDIQAKYDELVAQESDMVMEIIIDENDGGTMPAINLEGDDEAEGVEEEAAPKPASGDQSYNVGSPESKFVLVSMPAQEETPVTELPVTDVPAVEIPAAGVPVGEVPVGDAIEIVTEKVEGVVDTTVQGVADTGTAVVETVKTVETPVKTAPAVEIKTKPMQQTEAATEPIVADTTAVADSPAVTAAADETAADDVGGIGDMKDVDIGPMLTDDDDIVKRAKPLDEVADLIRRQLKGPDATQALTTAIKTAESELENYFTLRLQWEVNGKEKNRPEPPKPDFQELADRHGLRLAETELVDFDDLMKTELAQVYEVFTSNNRPVPVNLPRVIFGKFNELSEYSTSTTDSRFTGKSYVYWPTELADSKVPKLEECKEKIIEYWRQQKAVEAATEAAQGIAAKANKDNKLSAIDPAKTIQTGEFTWFQPRGQQAVLSSPIGVDSPSEEFMSTAFSLSEGETGVAVDGTGKTIYVIQSQSPKASMAEVGDDFLKNQLFRFQRLPPDVGLVSGHYFQEKALDWNREYVDSIGLEFMK